MSSNSFPRSHACLYLSLSLLVGISWAPASWAKSSDLVPSKLAQPNLVQPPIGLDATPAMINLAQTIRPNPGSNPGVEFRDDGLTPIPPNPIPEEPLPSQPLPLLPPPDQLLPQPTLPTVPDSSLPGDAPSTIYVERYEVLGSTVFSPEELAAVTNDYAGRDISFAELLQARSAITQLYVENGYINSGAFIPPQTLEGGVVEIQVIEGGLEAVNVTGTVHLNPSYVRDRLELAGATPLNVNRLLEGLQLLQLDPLIETISADLQAGARPGTSVLQVQVTEADPFSTNIVLDNGRSPSVGSFRRQFGVDHLNLIGFGDRFSFDYANTDGSDEFNASYTIPINPRNGTLGFSFGDTDSEVIEPPFDVLDISSESRYYEISYRQPLFQSPTEDFILGLTFSRQESQTELGIDDIGPFPLSPGADDQGRTRISALRFFQEWTERSSRHVLAARSQFSLGVDWFDATVNENAPDSRFLSWRGQGQWVRLLEQDLLLLVRTDLQFTGDSLVPLEQFGLGGQETVRGYRQDVLLTDNGALLSAEVRIPVLRIPEWEGVLQVVPFIDLGTGWNNQTPDPDPGFIAGTGIGLLWRSGDIFSARLDWGFPLVDIEGRDRTWQESGIYFSIFVSPF